MEAKELMIGDWIYINPWDEQESYHPNRITGVQHNSWRDDDYCDWVNCEDWDRISFIDIRSIPLTAEILEKNGFKAFEHNHHSEDFIFLEQEDGGYEVSINKKRIILGIIYYVHELQHAFRLCGIDEEIKL